MDKEIYLKEIRKMTALPEQARLHLEEMADKLNSEQRQEAVDKLKKQYPAVERAAEDLIDFYKESDEELVGLEREGRKKEEAAERKNEQTELDTLFDL